MTILPNYYNLENILYKVPAIYMKWSASTNRMEKGLEFDPEDDELSFGLEDDELSFGLEGEESDEADGGLG